MPMFGRIGRPGLIGLAARTAVVAGTATAVSGGMMAHQQRRAAEQNEAAQYEQQQQEAQFAAGQQIAPTPAAAPAPAPDTDDLIGELQKLATLHDSGALTDAEFAAAKARLLG